jgi:hypothetical protein
MLQVRSLDFVEVKKLYKISPIRAHLIPRCSLNKNILKYYISYADYTIDLR